MTKRLLCVVLVLAITFCCLPCVFAAENSGLSGPLGEDAGPTLLDTGRGYVVYYWYSSAIYFSQDGETWIDLSDRSWVKEAVPYIQLYVGQGHREFDLRWADAGYYVLRQTLLDDPRPTHKRFGDSPKNNVVTFLDDDFQVIGELPLPLAQRLVRVVQLFQRALSVASK